MLAVILKSMQSSKMLLASGSYRKQLHLIRETQLNQRNPIEQAHTDTMSFDARATALCVALPFGLPLLLGTND